MSLSTDTQRKTALKAVSGKANTLNSKAIYEEEISTALATHGDRVFAETIPTAATNPTLYQINGPCEYVRFELEYITTSGSKSYWTTDQEVLNNNDCNPCDTGDPNNDKGVEIVELPSSFDGRHAYAIKLPADYLDNSSNPNKDLLKYQNGAKLHESRYQLQLVGLSHGQEYYPKLFTGIGVGATEIPRDDKRDWVFDSVAGIVFQQDPPGPGDFPTNPTYVEGWLYIGEFLNESIDNLSGSIATDIDNIQGDILDLQNGGSSATTAIENDFVIKKLLGKAHTSPSKRHYNENISSYIYSNASHIPKGSPPIIGNAGYNYFHIEGGKVEYLRLSGSYVDGGQSIDGRHAIKLHLPNDYIAQTTNTKAGSNFWFNGQAINGTSGSIQMVPPYFNDNDSNYEAKPYYFDTSTNAYVVIPPEDERNWHMDYQAGILYQDSPEDTVDLDPVYVDAWVWVGGMMDECCDGSGGGGTGGGGGGAAGVIGPAEDGSYTDGLFIDFQETTPTGTAVDRFNEVLKALSPPPAPPLKEVDYNVTNGSIYEAKLSFDGTHQDPNNFFAPVETYTQSGQTGFSALAVNNTYETDSIVVPEANIDGGDLHFFRIGIVSGTQVIEGTANFTVPAETTATGVQQFSADSFGDADVGTLYLELNGVNIHNINLGSSIGTGIPTAGSGIDLNNDGSGFVNISATASNKTEGGKDFPIFQHRTVDFRITPTSMQPGHNKVRIKHDKGAIEYSTNYVEWVLDNTTDQIFFANSSVNVTNQQGSVYISGVQYHTSLTLEYQTDIANAYKAVHSSNPIITNSTAGTSNALPIPPIANGEDMTKVISFVNQIDVEATVDPLINETIDVTATVPHPIKGESTGGNAQTQPVLLYNPTDAATETIEDFVLEEYRVQQGDWLTQTTGVAQGFFDGSKLWDSTQHMSGSDPGHNTGLQIFTGKLVSPVNSIDTTRKGDFRSLSDSGELVTYDGNPDYSIEAGNITGTRTYYRYVKNITNFDQRDFRIIYRGDCNLIAATDSFTTTGIKVSVKLPETVSGDTTGWLDANSPFTMFMYGDNDGGFILPSGGSFDSTVGSNDSINYFTVGQKVVKPDEVVIIKIEADTSWTGNLDNLEIQWGASSAGNTAPGAIGDPQPLQTINAGQTGVTGKLSFGVNNLINNYENVTNLTTGADILAGETFGPSGYTNLGIFQNVDVSGDLNHLQSLDFEFNNGHLGELILEFNGNPIQTLDLTNLTLSGDQRMNGTGFYDLSEATPVTYSNGLPNFSRIYRTSKYSIDMLSQQPGHNYVKVIHRIGATDIETNYVEWVLDDNSDVMLISSATLDNFTDTNTSYLSGIKYFMDPSSQVQFTVENLYTNVYSTNSNGIGFLELQNVDLLQLSVSGTGINGKTTTTNATSLPELNGTLDCERQDVIATGQLNWNGSSKVIPGPYGTNQSQQASIKGRAFHPIKHAGGLTSSTLSKDKFLINNISNTSTADDNETFHSETYRLPNTTYTVASDITNATWDSAQNVVYGPVGYNDGLVVYNGYVIPPAEAGDNGNFASVADGGQYQGPSGNVNYSILADQTSDRTYMRAFYNDTTSDIANIRIYIEGQGTLTSETQQKNNAGPIGANSRFKLFVKLVEDAANANPTTGWLDAGEEWTGSNLDNAGISKMPSNALDVDLSGNSFVNVSLPAGRFLYGTLSSQNTNYIIIKLVAHKQWTGHVSRLGWGAN